MNTASYEYTLSFPNLVVEPGALQSRPLIPDRVTTLINGVPTEQWRFNPSPSQRWFDPPLASGFHFQGDGGTTFEEIMACPLGFGDDFKIYVNGTEIIRLAGGESVNFRTVTGNAVSSFEVKNIRPFVDSSSPVAFPIMLRFTADQGSLTMTPIKAPTAELRAGANGVMELHFEGTLQSSPDFQLWTDIPGISSPLIIPPLDPARRKFYRALLPE